MPSNTAKNIVTSDQTLYHYRILRPLGSGGYGQVFKARLIELNTMVALKRFRTSAGHTTEAVENWIREYNLHEALSHPNILQVLDAFQAGGYCYIVTELATCSIDAYLDDNECWHEEYVAHAGMQLASALHYLHAAWQPGQPVVHRDITPKNVFYFEREERFKIGDFGISRMLADDRDVAVTQVANWGFAAPDLMLLGHTVPQSDLYQLGLVLLCMASGSPPVDQSLSSAAKRRQIAEGVPFKIANKHDFDSVELKRIIKKLLYRDLAKRYPEAASVQKELTRLWLQLRR